MYTGEYSHTIDEKGRLIVPSKYRELLGDNFMVTRGFDGNLTMYDHENWEVFAGKINGLNATVKGSRMLKRHFIGGAIDVDIDKQGRVVIPGNLRAEANLKKNVVLLGVGDHIEIWDKDKFDADGKFGSIDEVAEHLYEMGITL